ncbi:MAG TPA: CvpA family protein [Daejeonella sp.]|nr:CvpA family protein [Daejeonella sp.]
MVIDAIFIFLMIFALIKGYRKGFVVAIFSFLGIVIGMVAAMKFSTLVARWLQNNTHISLSWLPFLSFVLVMVGVILLVRLGALFIQSALDLVLMGWLNKIAGILLYAALYTTLFSVILFYAGKMNWLKPATFADSHTYSFIQPWGPKAVNAVAVVIPFCKGMFEDLTHFFDSL